MTNSQTTFEQPSELPEIPVVQELDELCPACGAQMLRLMGSAETTRDICPDCAENAMKAQIEADQQRFIQTRHREFSGRRQRALEQRMGAALIPPRYAEWSFDSFPASSDEQREAVAQCRSYANTWPEKAKKGTSALLLGSVGTGKTGMACAIANHILREFGASALYTTAYGCIRHQRDTWGRKGKTEREALGDLVDVDLLILDEVGAQIGSDAEMAMLYEVLNGRYAQRKPVILLSNLPLNSYESNGQKRPGLRVFLGQRIVDRFQDDGSFVLTMNWQSLRGAA